MVPRNSVWFTWSFCCPCYFPLYRRHTYTQWRGGDNHCVRCKNTSEREAALGNHVPHTTKTLPQYHPRVSSLSLSLERRAIPGIVLLFIPIPYSRLCASCTLGGENMVCINPFRTAVPFWGQTTQIPSKLSPKRDCGPKRVHGKTIPYLNGHSDPREHVKHEKYNMTTSFLPYFSQIKTAHIIHVSG